MRRLFTSADSGLTSNALRWGERIGRWVRVQRGVYADGPEPPTPLDRERAQVLATGATARGALAGVLLGLDSVELDGMPVRKGRLVAERTSIIGGVRCVGALQALLDLAASTTTRGSRRWSRRCASDWCSSARSRTFLATCPAWRGSAASSPGAVTCRRRSRCWRH